MMILRFAGVGFMAYRRLAVVRRSPILSPGLPGGAAATLLGQSRCAATADHWLQVYSAFWDNRLDALTDLLGKIDQ